MSSGIKTPIEHIPEHLQEYITEQDPSLYSPIDHATWRYIMRVSKAFLSKHAHPLYLHGLEATGISTERIPLVSEMDAALRKLGWRAVAINGFIPPAIFLEFQSLRILAIACDIRKLENLGYTPSPDIVHEAAGHAPIVADPGYRAYLEAYGEVARNAIISKFDLDLYAAIFRLSEIKEDPKSTPEAIADAQKNFEFVASLETDPSEVALLTRMAWWTTEYGLIGSVEKPLIYGAGLLSSVSESYDCVRPSVKKIPFSLKATIETSYDITRPQPQLFVAKDFDELTTALNDFANGMAFRLGGAKGLKIAKTAQNTVTVALDNGVQLTGTVLQYEVNQQGEVCSFTLGRSKQISYRDVAVESLGYQQLSDEIIFPLFDRSITTTTLPQLEEKLNAGGIPTLNGTLVQGHIQREIKLSDSTRILLVELNAKITPVVLASKVVSVFGGAGDRKEFALRNSNLVKKVSSHQSNLTTNNTELSQLYQKVRLFRDSQSATVEELKTITQELDRIAPTDWLLRLEILELYKKHLPEHDVATQLHNQLMALAQKDTHLLDLIHRGLEII